MHEADKDSIGMRLPEAEKLPETYHTSRILVVFL